MPQGVETVDSDSFFPSLNFDEWLHARPLYDLDDIDIHEFVADVLAPAVPSVVSLRHVGANEVMVIFFCRLGFKQYVVQLGGRSEY